jgi:uncharacterized RDD family membrane protein YckC
MKCPKCGYLGFEHVERCRNCGYDFSLTSSSPGPGPELPLRVDTRSIHPLDDLSLIDEAMASTSSRAPGTGPDLERVFGAPDVMPQPKAPAYASPTGRREELPLFGPPIPDDEPLITKASPPRQPLAVRRATLDVARGRPEQMRAPTLDLILDLGEPAAELIPATPSKDDSWSGGDGEPAGRGAPDAAVGARLLAVVIDLLILAIVDAAVIYFTMQICGVGLEDLGILPKGPLLAFLFVQNGGYLVAFTAGGQTLGKMVSGIRVVTAGEDAPLDLGHAFLRTSMWLLLAVPAGLGFLTALLSRDRRGLHDRFAGTRVVRASA